MNYTQCRLLTFASWTLLVITLLIFNSGATAETSDDYLKALEAEAEAISLLPGDAVASEDSSPVSNSSDEKYLKQKDAFEKELQQTLPNTYTIYRKLSSEKKAIVVETFYFNEMKMPVASRQIFNFYFNDRKN